MLLSNISKELIAPSGIASRAACTLRRFAQLVICGERHFSRYGLISSRTTNIDSITHKDNQRGTTQLYHATTQLIILYLAFLLSSKLYNAENRKKINTSKLIFSSRTYHSYVHLNIATL